MGPAAIAILDSTDWHAVKHAYGPATDVPQLLRDLATSDSKRREAALYGLHGNIWHQGTVYPATVPSVRVLLAMLVHGDVLEPENILAFLCLVANGEEPGCEHVGHESARGVVQSLGDLFESFTPHLLAYLGHPRPEVRAAAIALLSLVKSGVPALVPHLSRERDTLVRAHLLLGLTERSDSPPAEPLLLAAMKVQDPERTAAALSLLRSRGIVSPGTHANALLAAKDDTSTVEQLEQYCPSVAHFVSWLEEWDGSDGADWP